MIDRPLLLCLAVLLGVLLAAAPAGAQNSSTTTQRTPADLKKATLEELLRFEVTSASKREETLLEASSSIWVITNEDLARSGVTTIAEALRMVPGLQVARIDGNKWAVSARGFNGRFADKMLVLIDGRSVYTPLFSGVYWDVQDTMVADIDRIEVIRGPGATLWGANAVNGVINIITKNTSDTHGASVSAKTSTIEPGVIEARYGGRLGGAGDGRVFLKYANRDALESATGGHANDQSEQVHVGFRADWRLSRAGGLTAEGETYRGSSGTTYGPGSLLPFYATRQTATGDVRGGHLLTRWTRAFSPASDFSVQAFFDRTSRGETALAGEARNTADVEVQQHVRFSTAHDLVWGAGFRTTGDEITPGSTVEFTPVRRRDHLSNLFLQHEADRLGGRLRVRAGVKAEHNSYTGWEWQPDGRVSLVLSPRQTVWGAVSRAVRTPSRAEAGVRLDTTPIQPAGALFPTVFSLRGNPAFLSETVRAHEVGYRIQPRPSVSIEAAAFYNVYDHLRTFERGEPGVDPAGGGIVVPLTFGNQMEGRSKGVELTGRLAPTSEARVEVSYSYLALHLAHEPGSTDTLGIVIEDNSPRHQLRVHAGTTIAQTVEIDATAHYVGRLVEHAIPGFMDHVPAYTRVDARVAWRVKPGVTLAAGARNLLDRRHIEFPSTLGEVPSEIPRSGYVQLIFLR